MCTLPGVFAESTYKMCYKGELPTIPSFRYKTLPCMYQSETIMAERQWDIQPSRPALKRAMVPVPQPPKQPIPTKPRPSSSVRLSTTSKDCPIKVLDTKFGAMDMELIEKLYNKYRYTSCTQKAAAECVLPIEKPKPPKTTMEPKADMVRLLSQRYETRAEEWQDAVLWDRLQSRYPTDGIPQDHCKEKLLREGYIGNHLQLDQARLNQIRKLVQTDGLAGVFAPKCPGYAGYSPLCPPETKLNDKKNPPEMATLMSSSYRKFPDEVYHKQSFARRAPFSTTVTLTYPFNPFNKVGEEISAVETGAQYSANGKLIGLNSNVLNHGKEIMLH